LCGITESLKLIGKCDFQRYTRHAYDPRWKGDSGPTKRSWHCLAMATSATNLGQKVVQYFAYGARLAWVVNPKERTVSTYASRKQSRLLSEPERLDVASLLPGFSLPMKEPFELPDLA